MTIQIPIEGCSPVPLRLNADRRGCLFEVYREQWPGMFKTVQWNVCASSAGVMRGVHVHVDYAEFYTLPQGHVFVALKDLRRGSPTFGNVAAFEWRRDDGFGLPIPAGVAHAIYFVEDALLVFGLSDYWRSEWDVLGCRWDDLDPQINWPSGLPVLSARDAAADSFESMLKNYETLQALHRKTIVAGQ